MLSCVFYLLRFVRVQVLRLLLSLLSLKPLCVNVFKETQNYMVGEIPQLKE